MSEHGAEDWAEVVAHDRAQQAFADLALQVLPDQFPAAITVQATRDAVAGTPHTATLAVSDLATMALDRAISGWRTLGSSDEPIGVLPTSALTTGPTQVLNIRKLLSAGTAQGVVYLVDVQPHERLAKHLARRGGSDGRVPAVMKKSAIVPVWRWKQRAALRLAQAWGNAPPMSREGQALRVALVDARVTAPNEAATQALLRGDVAADLERANDDLSAEYVDRHNEAYIDALGCALVSAVAEAGASPFFPITYATLRAFDRAFFDRKTVAVYGDGINADGFPVEIVIQQPLDGGSRDLAESWMRGGPVKGPELNGPLVGSRLLSFWAQIVFGLSALQALVGGVNNDFHLDNALFEEVPEDVVLYYRALPWGSPAPATLDTDAEVYAVPTWGAVVKMIDYGRASFSVGGVRIESTTHDEIFRNRGGFGNRGSTTDLVRAALCFARTFGDAFMARGPDRGDTAGEAVHTLLSSVLSCGMNTPTWRGRAANAGCGIPDRDLALYQPPYPCHSAVPGMLFEHLAPLRIPAEQVPAEAIVYPVWRSPYPMQSREVPDAFAANSTMTAIATGFV